MNGFLASLDNNATAPINGSSVVGSVAWPTPFNVKIFTAIEQEAYSRLFGTYVDRLTHFVKAIQLLIVVQNSVCADYIATSDPVITYNDTQLIGQSIGISSSYLHTADAALSQIHHFDASTLLTGDLLDIWTNALSPGDKLAALVTYFGTLSGLPSSSSAPS